MSNIPYFAILTEETMKKVFYPLLGLALLACGEKEAAKKEPTTPPSYDEKFSTFTSEFINAYWAQNPLQAADAGFHLYDDQLPLPDEQGRREQIAFAEKYLQQLNEFDYEQLSDHNKIDYKILKNKLKAIPFYLEELKSYEWNPAGYNLGGAFFQVINYRGNSLQERIKAVSTKLDKVAAYYTAARKNIKKPTVVHTELAIQQLEGSKGVFTKNLLDSLARAEMDSAFVQDFHRKITEAVAAIETFKKALEEEELPLAKKEGRSFRIGKELFEKKFNYEIQSASSAEEIFNTAVEEKGKLHDNLYQLSELLWEKYMGEKEKPGKRLDQIRMVINEVAKNHVHRDSFVIAIRKQIPALEAFVVENDVLSLDPEKPLVVRETPEYMRGFAGASISAPGPYDAAAETYYNVTPLDHYSEEAAESYLREYNNFTLQILNIHEAIPGHYTQLVYSNQSPSLVKSLFGNGAMIEGWAVYAERMMLENNYGGDNLEMGLMYYKWNLRTVCNTILDYGVHVLDFSEEEAMQLLVNEAFQEMSEAQGKWRRARLSQVQLCSYFTGYHEIMALREQMRMVKEDQFTLKDFHESFLSYGSAPVKHISELMLRKVKAEREKEEKPV
jgi:uncharacterized protein (DUF885 family)